MVTAARKGVRRKILAQMLVGIVGTAVMTVGCTSDCGESLKSQTSFKKAFRSEY